MELEVEHTHENPQKHIRLWDSWSCGNLLKPRNQDRSFRYHIRMQGGPFVLDIRVIMRCIKSGCTIWGEDDIMISGCKGSPLVHYIYMKMTLGASYHDISGCNGVLWCKILGWLWGASYQDAQYEVKMISWYQDAKGVRWCMIFTWRWH